VDDLTVLEVVGSEPEAELVCSILRDAGIQCMQRITNAGSGAMDGLSIGGPREIVVRSDQLTRAREVMQNQRR
jgi:Putative prokaryotic signal transducing protein